MYDNDDLVLTLVTFVLTLNLYVQGEIVTKVPALGIIYNQWSGTEITAGYTGAQAITTDNIFMIKTCYCHAGLLIIIIIIIEWCIEIFIQETGLSP